MREIVKRPSATADVKKIWHDTSQKWGTAKATHYLKEIDKAVLLLATSPQRGKSIDHVRKGYRKFRCQHHFIIYRHTESLLEISRILHERMDLPTRIMDD